MPGLGTTYGRGGATAAPNDLLNSDAILIMGSNMAENHPVGFQWVIEAKERGTKVLHVDPRFSRTSAVANIWVPLRAGSDILFLGGLIRYVLENNLFFREYVVHYTNASVIIPEDFKDTEDLEGIFSGWNAEKKTYDAKTWLYEGVDSDKRATPEGCHGGHVEEGLDAMPDLSRYHQDLTLQHPRCVFQLLRKHFARYTPEMVERYCGVSKDAFLHAAKTFCTASGPDKTGAICYALGWTQHSSGVQMIRCAAILQLLLGNMGRPGGGILALRGHASIQGSTDVPTLYDILPGYLSMPKFGEESKTLRNYIDKYSSRTGWWHNLDKYIVSLLKAYYGESAQPENEFGFHWLPRVTGDHSHQGYWLDMLDGKMDGLFVMGQNPAVAGPNSGMERRGLGKLKWLVVREMVETETASFWYESPEVKRGELRTEEIPTEVFLLPAAGHAEKDGTFTNTQRLLQWRQKAVAPPGDSRSENWFMYHLGVLLREKAKRDPRPRNAGLLALKWDYTIEGEHREPIAEEILQEINGYTVPNHELVPARIGRISGLPRASMAMDGGSPGLPTGEFFTIALPPVPTAIPGVSERSSFGGISKARNGRASTFPISRPLSLLTISRPRTPKAMLAWQVTSLSSCMAMASDGSGSRSALTTGRCPLTTSLSSLRSATRSIPSAKQILRRRRNHDRGTSTLPRQTPVFLS